MITQLPLIEGAAPLRPTRRSPEMDEAIARRLLPRVIEWLKGGNGYYGDDEKIDEKIKAELMEAMDRAMGLDAFRVAKELDWEGDRELVDILDEAVELEIEIHDQHVAQWIADWGVVPRFQRGAAVRVRENGHERGREVEGTIIEVDTRLGIYTVNSPALGHKDPKTPGTGTLGLILPWEKVEAWNEEGDSK